jgi:hypothetical protein
MTKPPLQKILQGILHRENERKQNYKRIGIPNHGRRKNRNQRVTLI